MRISSVGLLDSFAVQFSGKKSKKAGKAKNNPNEQSKKPIVITPPINGFYQKHEDVDKMITSMQSNDCGPEILQKAESLSKDKKGYFINKYCIHTGFPDLEKVNKKIKNEAKTSILKSADEAGVKVLGASFNSHSSVNFNLGLPGSDMDALGIIVDTDDRDKINNFKGRLWQNTDPTIISIRQDFEFPDVYSLDEIDNWTGMLNRLTEKEGLDKKVPQYQENKKETDDYKKALEFNTDMAAMLKKYTNEELIEQSDDKELTKNLLEKDGKTPTNITQSMSSLLESIRSGTPLIETELDDKQNEKMQRIKSSYLYTCGNICIQDADFPLKDKLKARKEKVNQENFDKLNQDDKMDLILRMYYESYSGWDKQKVSKPYGEKFDYLFNNGENVDNKRIEAYQGCADS